MNERIKRILTSLAPILGAGAIGVCPLCWIGSASLLTYLGLGALIPVWQPIALVLLLVGVAGFVLDFRSHRNWRPLLLLVVGGVLLFVGRYVFGGGGFGAWPIWGPGAVLVLAAVILNKREFRRTSQTPQQ